MNWIDYFDENIGLKKVLDGTDSQLKSVQLKEIVFKDDGPNITLVVILNEFPKNPPEKWKVGKCNEMQVRLGLFEVKAISMSGWSTNNIGDFLIEKVSDRNFDIEFRCNNNKFYATCSFLYIEGFSAYQVKK